MINSQVDFFNFIKLSAPANLNIAQNVADILNVSINEAYKKMRGTSALNFQQILQICDAFKVPFNYQPDKSETVSFSLPKIDLDKPDMVLYLKDLLEILKNVHKLKKRHVTITTDDIPIFHFFKYPELTCFKLFFWADSLSSSTAKFEASFINSEITDLTQQLSKLYLEIPSTEIWSKDTVHGTIEQIRYAFEAGYLQDKELAEKVLEQFRSCLTDINMYAVGSKKTMDNQHTFNWYCCDVLGSISYLVEGNDTMSCFNRFNTFSYLKTENQQYCEQTKHWMNGLIKKSVSFSGHGEKHRNKYLYNSYAEIDQMLNEINSNSWSLTK